MLFLATTVEKPTLARFRPSKMFVVAVCVLLLLLFVLLFPSVLHVCAAAVAAFGALFAAGAFFFCFDAVWCYWCCCLCNLLLFVRLLLFVHCLLFLLIFCFCCLYCCFCSFAFSVLSCCLVVCCFCGSFWGRFPLKKKPPLPLILTFQNVCIACAACAAFCAAFAAVASVCAMLLLCCCCFSCLCLLLSVLLLLLLLILLVLFFCVAPASTPVPPPASYSAHLPVWPSPRQPWPPPCSVLHSGSVGSSGVRVGVCCSTHCREASTRSSETWMSWLQTQLTTADSKSSQVVSHCSMEHRPGWRLLAARRRSPWSGASRRARL